MKKARTVRTARTAKITKVAKMQFNEMLYQVRVLLTLKGGCSEEDIKNQFSNIHVQVVEEFLEEMIKQGIIEEHKGTLTLRQLEISTQPLA